MERKSTFIRAALLWLTLPLAAFDLAKKYYNVVLPVIAIICVVIFFSIRQTAIAKGPEKNLPTIEITDLTAAFATGIDKHQPNRYIVIHHTASNGENKISDIARIHLGHNQWSKIAYHYFIDKHNKVYQFLPENESSPNAYHRNNDAVAICLAGNYSEIQPSDSTLQVLAALVRIVMQRNNIAAENVVRHRDVPDNATECCGKNFDIEKFRKKLQ